MCNKSRKKKPGNILSTYFFGDDDNGKPVGYGCVLKKGGTPISHPKCWSFGCWKPHGPVGETQQFKSVMILSELAGWHRKGYQWRAEIQGVTDDRIARVTFLALQKGGPGFALLPKD